MPQSLQQSASDLARTVLPPPQTARRSRGRMARERMTKIAAGELNYIHQRLKIGDNGLKLGNLTAETDNIPSAAYDQVMLRRVGALMREIIPWPAYLVYPSDQSRKGW